MINIGEALLPQSVNLALVASDKASAVHEVAIRLRGDSRVTNWDLFEKAVLERDAPAMLSCGYGICIAHGRTPGVCSIVMALGRSDEGIVFPEVAEPVRLVFVAGIPAALSSEYLRIVGAIVRICRDPALLQKILTVKDADKFVSLLGSEEHRLF
ncbi:MAG: PTS sugar transporter subunit IIA [Chthoniobacterales bacterium]